jgi:hypothetical protein
LGVKISPQVVEIEKTRTVQWEIHPAAPVAVVSTQREDSRIRVRQTEGERCPGPEATCQVISILRGSEYVGPGVLDEDDEGGREDADARKVGGGEDSLVRNIGKEWERERERRGSV